MLSIAMCQIKKTARNMFSGSLIVYLITVKLFFLLWHVDGLGVHIQRCFHDALGDRGMRVGLKVGTATFK